MYVNFNEVNHSYNRHTPMETRVLFNVNFQIEKGTLTCLIGHTGSGKSTILQHFNGLLRPDSGTVTVPGGVIDNSKKLPGKVIKGIRQKVGLVFQFPEYQLFEETVLKDIMFGPLNYGRSKTEAERLAREAALIVGLDEALLTKSPFELSGGQMRRVAIAGILAMEPDVIVLDEPTAGLDPAGQQEILEIFLSLKEAGRTVVIVTHDMDIVGQYAQQVIVMNKGHVVLDGPPSEVFKEKEILNEAGIQLPTAARIYEQAFGTDGALPLTLDAFVETILQKA